MAVPGSSFHLARIIANAMFLGARGGGDNESMTNYVPDDGGFVDQTKAGNATFRVTYIDQNIEGPDKRRSFTVNVREGV